jgi:small subunit ribosomal protein S1
VVSRRKLLEERRNAMRDDLLATLEEGQIRKGTVKNIADFGAFLDIGGVDGLLHITDMSWGRVSHPSEVVSLEQELEVKVLRFDRERNRIALGLKQLEASPWQEVERKYPVGTRVKGEVVNIMPYGAFVKIEDGIEGLVHISEMSWTRRVNHPSELVEIDGEVEVVPKEWTSRRTRVCTSYPFRSRRTSSKRSGCASSRVGISTTRIVPAVRMSRW